MSPPSSSLFYSAWERKEGGGLGEVQRRSRVSARWDADVHICRKGTGDREAGRSITELDERRRLMGFLEEAAGGSGNTQEADLNKVGEGRNSAITPWKATGAGMLPMAFSS